MIGSKRVIEIRSCSTERLRYEMQKMRSKALRMGRGLGDAVMMKLLPLLRVILGTYSLQVTPSAEVVDRVVEMVNPIVDAAMNDKLAAVFSEFGVKKIK